MKRSNEELLSSETDSTLHQRCSEEQVQISSSSGISPEEQPLKDNSIVELAGRSWSQFFKTLSKFIGPGFIVSVGYLDPGKYGNRILTIL
jgi:hypothetical protein